MEERIIASKCGTEIQTRQDAANLYSHELHLVPMDKKNSPYLPQPGEVTYDFTALSQRLLYVREQIIKSTRSEFAHRNMIAESTLKCYEEGEFEPRYSFFHNMRFNQYGPYMIFILTGTPKNKISVFTGELPAIAFFSDRLAYLRGTIFQASRPMFSSWLQGFSASNVKHYERRERVPNIAFILLCITHPLLSPYFYWLMWGVNKPIKQAKFNLARAVADAGDGSRILYNQRIGALHSKNKDKPS